MSIKSKKKLSSLTTTFIKAYDTFDLARIQKAVKHVPTHNILDALNGIDNIKIVIFVMVALEKLKPMKLFLGVDFDKQKSILELATDIELKMILKFLYPDDLLEVLEMHKDFAKRIYLSIDHERRQGIKYISTFDDDEIGHIMNPRFLSLNKDWSIKKAISYIQEEVKHVETTNWIFVVNGDFQLVGVIRLYDLFFVKNINTKISTIMDTDYIAVDAKLDIEDVINMFDKYSIEILAVVNSKNILLGFIRNSDITAAIQGETTEDIYKMYGITELHVPYLHSSIWKIASSRLLWLSILMVSATLTSIVLEQFQDLGQALTAGISTILLVPILPVLTGTSGNAGSQASASIIRSLSIGEITKQEYWKAIMKEMRVGIIVGLSLAVINFVRLLIYYLAFNNIILENIIEIIGQNNTGAIKIPTEMQLYATNTIVSAASSLALFVSIFIAKMLGAILPIAATKFKIDPTVMSAPILATILDVTTTTTLFGIGIGVISSVFPGI